jgi:hypothetical protein
MYVCNILPIRVTSLGLLVNIRQNIFLQCILLVATRPLARRPKVVRQENGMYRYSVQDLHPVNITVPQKTI